MGGGGGGSGWGGGGHGGCKQRIEAFVKIQKKLIYIYFGGGWVGSGRGGGRVWGVRVDVNGEVKFL